MKPFRNLLAVILATLWVGLSEFFRNEILLKSLWVNQYQRLGLVFPSDPVNKVVWAIWSFMFVGVIYNIAKKFSLAGTALLSWFAAFPMMWIMLGNLSVMPHNYMLYSTPITLLESFVATLILKKFTEPHANNQ